MTTLGNKRVKQPEGGTLGYEGSGREATERGAAARAAKNQGIRAPGAVRETDREATGTATGKDRAANKETTAAADMQALRQLSDHFPAEQPKHLCGIHGKRSQN